MDQQHFSDSSSNSNSSSNSGLPSSQGGGGSQSAAAVLPFVAYVVLITVSVLLLLHARKWPSSAPLHSTLPLIHYPSSITVSSYLLWCRGRQRHTESIVQAAEAVVREVQGDLTHVEQTLLTDLPNYVRKIQSVQKRMKALSGRVQSMEDVLLRKGLVDASPIGGGGGGAAESHVGEKDDGGADSSSAPTRR